MLNRWRQLKGQWHPLAKRLETDPSYRLRSYQEVQLAAEVGFTIDVNQATVDDWLKLPGISIRQAQTLHQLRGAGIQFYCVEDLAAALGTSVAHLTPLAKVLVFCHYDRDGAITPYALNLNRASLEQLSQLPYVSPQLANNIVRDRTHHGPFQSLVDFQHRLGLSPEHIQHLMHYCHT